MRISDWSSDVCSSDLPNWQVYQRAAQRADMFGRIELVRLPSPGRILHGDEVVPASYMNFYIGNASVVVPQYGAENAAAPPATIADLLPHRTVVGPRSAHLLTARGSFHFTRQPLPAHRLDG